MRKKLFCSIFSRCCGTRIRVEMSSGRSRRDDRKRGGGGGGGGRNRYRYVLYTMHFSLFFAKIRKFHNVFTKSNPNRLSICFSVKTQHSMVMELFKFCFSNLNHFFYFTLLFDKEDTSFFISSIWIIIFLKIKLIHK